MRRSGAGRLGCIIAAAAAMFATVISAAPAAGAQESEHIVPGTYTDTASVSSIFAGTATTETFTLTNTSTTQSSIGSAQLTLGGLQTTVTLGSSPVSKSNWSAKLSTNTAGFTIITLGSQSQSDGDNDSDDSSAVAPGKSVSVTVSLKAAAAGSIPVSSIVQGSGTFGGGPTWALKSGTKDPTITVSLSPQTITFAALPTTGLVNAPALTASAIASSGLPVTFSADSNSTPGACSVTGATISLTGAGTCVIDANQPGNGVYAAAPQVQQDINVSLNPQTITFTAFPEPAYVGATLPAIATTTAPDLTVEFSVDSGPCAVSGNNISLTGAGTCVIDANQPGNGVYAAAPQVQQDINVSLNPQTITFTAFPEPAYVGATLPAIATTTAQGLTVVFSVDSGPCAVSGNNISLTGAGTCVIDANQPGNGVYAAAPQVQQDINVSLNPQTITFTAFPEPAYVGATLAAIATTTAQGLTVVFSVDSGPCAVSGNNISLTGAGTCVIDANQPGNGVYAAAPQVQQDINVVAPVLIFSQEPPTSVQQSLPLSNNFTFMCSPVTVQLQTSGGTNIAASGVNITIAVASGSANPGLYYSTSPGSTPSPVTSVTVATNSNGAAVFGTGTAPNCTSGLAATNVGPTFELSASASGAASVASTAFAVTQTVITCTTNCSTPTNTSSNTGATGQVSASTNGTFTLVTSFGQGDQLNCDSAVSSSAADPYLVEGVGGGSGTTATKTVTMVFPKSVVQSEPIPNAPLMAVCVGATRPFPTWLPYKGSTTDPYQGLLFGCADPLYIVLAPFAPLDMCVQSEHKSSAGAETVVISITSSTNVDPHAW